MSENKNIDILLSVYNGGMYLESLLGSLLVQSNQSWNLLVRDDGSSDNSLEIIKKFKDKIPIVLIDDNAKRLGPSQSFAKLMTYSGADYVMFCDQDDIWLPNKIDEAYQCMIKNELLRPNTPVLVHTDLTVVNNQLDVISRSFWDYQHINQSRNQLKDLLLQNVVTGCTCMINKPLKEVCLPIPADVVMHDWWLGLVASSYGTIEHISSSQILYRQHDNNEIGAKKYGIGFLIKRALKTRALNIMKLVMQAECFYQRYSASLPIEIQTTLQQFVSIPFHSRIWRIRSCIKYKFKKHGIIRNVGLYITLLLMKRINKY